MIYIKEEWKKIEEYHGKYEISNLGRIKSYAQSKEGKILTGYKDKKGYMTIRLYNEPQKGKWYKIHRLVAMSFIENPNNYPEVNHKDENKENNRVDNLEWCDSYYNNNYGTKILRVTEKNKCCETTSKKVYSMDIIGNITYYDSIGEAERITGLNHSNIVRTLKGRTQTCGGLKWFYVI